MTHGLFTSSHLKNINCRVISKHGRVDVVVEWTDWRALVDEVEVDCVTIKDFGIES